MLEQVVSQQSNVLAILIVAGFSNGGIAYNWFGPERNAQDVGQWQVEQNHSQLQSDHIFQLANQQREDGPTSYGGTEDPCKGAMILGDAVKRQ